MIKIDSPFTKEKLAGLKAGDKVNISGIIYTARDQAHKRLIEMLAKGGELPFDLTDAGIYYVGPSPAHPGCVIGSAGPTTSYRMDAYAPALLDHGLKVMIGKGPRSESVIE
ncbi:MAG: fumarate hydratase C-terminal domain-containing protein, partial [Firmicutes bacterium]|nr:fumarate hydratase C-terminal domain-containing protein [Bacillota bacterium]